MAMRLDQQRRTHEKIVRLTAATMFDPYLAKIKLTDLCELPDGVRNNPVECQKVWMVTFNNWIDKHGDVGKAMLAANGALETMRRREARKKRERWYDRYLKPEFDNDRLKPLRPQIVVL